MVDITDAIVLMDGQAVIVNRSLIGVKALHVKTMPDVHNKALHSIATAPEDGLENFVMFNKSLAKLQLKIEVYLAPSFAKMVVTVRMQMMEPTAMNVSACLVSKEAIVKRISTNALLIHVKMVPFVKTSLEHIDANVQRVFKDQNANLMSMIAILIHVRTMVNATI